MPDNENMQDLPFDLEVDLPHRQRDIAKWRFIDEDVLPAWVADMDFPSPPAITEAMKQRADDACFGYTMTPEALPKIIVERLKRLYDWDVKPEELVFIPGMVLSLNLISGALMKAGNGVLMQTPVYGPFLKIPETQGLFANMVDMVRVDDSAHTFHYEIDFDAFENAITPQTKMFYLCNPHNPGGRAFNREELTRMIDICQRHDVTIVSDEIHSDLLLGDTQHIPLGSLITEHHDRVVTLIAPSKTYNIPGLPCSIAIIQDENTRKKIEVAAQSMGVHVNIMGFVAAQAGYEYGDKWLKEVLAYITANRDYVVDYIGEHLPMLKTTVPEATYLMWIDCSALNLPDGKSAQEFFVDEARVALSPGSFFGKTGEPFVRLNLATRRSTLEQIMTRLKNAVNKQLSGA